MAGPGIIGAIRIAFVVGSLIAALFGKKRDEGPRNIQNLQLQTTQKGTPLPVIYGTQRVAGNVIWAGKAQPHSGGGGKGGKGGQSAKGGGQQQTTYTASFAVAFCEGPITGFNRIWEDKKILDLSQYSNITFYLGTGYQAADPTIKGAVGVVGGISFTDTRVGSGSNLLFYLSNTPIVSGSDTVFYMDSTKQGQQQVTLTRVSSNPGQNQYTIAYSSGAVQLGGSYAQTTTFYIQYQQSAATTVLNNTEHYPYVAYIVFANWNLGNNTRLPNITAEITNATVPPFKGMVWQRGSPNNVIAFSTDGQTIGTQKAVPSNWLTTQCLYYDGVNDMVILGTRNDVGATQTIWLSQDSGTTWKDIGMPVFPSGYSASPASPWVLITRNNVILLGLSNTPTSSGAALIARSIDQGGSWQFVPVGTGGSSSGGHSGTTSGCSILGHRQWQTPDGRVWACVGNNGNFIESGVTHLFSSADDGQTWQLSLTGIITNSLTGGPTMTFQYGNGAYFCCEGRSATTTTEITFRMYRSTDGVSWSLVGHDGDGVFTVNINLLTQSNRKFMGQRPDGQWLITQDKQYFSTDNGSTWGSRTGWAFWNWGTITNPANGVAVLTGTDTSQHIVWSTDGGQTTAGTLDSNVQNVSDIYIDPPIAGLGNSADMNPADIFLDLLTHTRYGGGIPLANVDTVGTFSTARTYYANNNLLLSPIFKDRKQLLQHCEDLLIILDTFLTWSQGLIRLIPRQSVQTPRAITTASYVGEKASGGSLGQTGPGTGNISHRLGRQTVKETLNRVLMHYVDRSQEYTPSTVDAKDDWMIGRDEGTELEVGAEAVTNQALANQMAFRILWVRSFNRLTATLTLGPQDQDIDVTDVISWTDANIGISGQLMRVMNLSEDKNGNIKADVIEENPVILGWASFLPLPQYTVGAVQPPAKFVATILILAEVPPPFPGGNPSIEVALVPVDSAWFGARLYASDDGSTYTKVLQVGAGTVAGAAVNA